jgi:hypothetical protein
MASRRLKDLLRQHSPTSLQHTPKRRPVRQKPCPKKQAFYFFLNLPNDQNIPKSTHFEQQWRVLETANYTPKELSIILHRTATFLKQSRCKKFKNRYTAFLQENIESWAIPATEDIEKFNPQELANSLWAFATLSIEPPPQFLNAWVQKATKDIEKFNSQDLANSLWAFATLGIKPPPQFLNAWVQKATKDIEKFKPQELANSLWAFASLGIKPPPQFLNAWVQKATKDIEKFHSQDLANSLWALAVIDSISDHTQYDRAIVVKMGNRLLEKEQIHSKGYNQYIESCLWFDIPYDVKYTKRSDKKSISEQYLKERFNAAGMLMDEKAIVIDEVKRRVDMSREKWKQKIVTQYDGPYHFLKRLAPNNTYEIAGYNGSTKFQSALLSKLRADHVFIHVPYLEEDKFYNGDFNRKDSKLRRDFVKAWKYKPGVYSLHNGQIVQGLNGGTRAPETQSLWSHISRYI